jgi:hypothetical protein
MRGSVGNAHEDDSSLSFSPPQAKEGGGESSPVRGMLETTGADDGDGAGGSEEQANQRVEDTSSESAPWALDSVEYIETKPSLSGCVAPPIVEQLQMSQSAAPTAEASVTYVAITSPPPSDRHMLSVLHAQLQLSLIPLLVSCDVDTHTHTHTNTHTHTHTHTHSYTGADGAIVGRRHARAQADDGGGPGQIYRIRHALGFLPAPRITYAEEDTLLVVDALGFLPAP